MKLSKKTRWTILIAATACILVVCSFLYLAFNMLRERFRHENMRGIEICLELYRDDNNDMLPDFDRWCDTLIAECDLSQKTFQGVVDYQEGVCGYALNENLAGRKISELPDKTVLLFEAKGPWNLTGEAELAKQWKHNKFAVIFVDGSKKYVKKEDIDTLEWNP